MNLLQQLSETKLTKEEIEAIIDLTSHAVSTYNDTVQSLNKVIELASNEDYVSGIKITIVSEDGEETKGVKSTNEIVEYRNELIAANTEVMEHLDSATKKLKELTKIFE